jgi:bacterioferritin
MKQQPQPVGDSKQKVPKHPANIGPDNMKAQLTTGNGNALPPSMNGGVMESKVGVLSPLLTDKSLLRKLARKSTDDGAVTPDYSLDKETVIGLLNESLATELVCTLRYKRHYYVANGIKGRFVASEFKQHAIEELAHADLIAERIMQLGGTPDFNPVGLADRSHAEYFAGTDLHDMVRENLVAERIAIESYRAFIQFLGDKDPTTRSMLESILAMEEEHADDLTDLLKD